MKRALSIMWILGLLITGAMATGCSHQGDDIQSTPEGVVEAFITAFQQKNLEAIGRLYSNGQIDSEEQEFLSKLFTVIEIKNFQVDEVVHLSEKEAEVKLFITMIVYNREKTLANSFKLIKKDRRWYLSTRFP